MQTASTACTLLWIPTHSGRQDEQQAGLIPPAPDFDGGLVGQQHHEQRGQVAGRSDQQRPNDQPLHCCCGGRGASQRLRAAAYNFKGNFKGMRQLGEFKG